MVLGWHQKKNARPYSKITKAKRARCMVLGGTASA
jgi:hypothetical protein